MVLLAGAVALAVLFTPGYLLARIWGVRGLSAWGSAPALSLAVLGVGSILSPWLGFSWHWRGVLTGPTMWVLILGLLLGAALRYRLCATSAVGPECRLSIRGRRRIGGALLAAALLTGIPLVLGLGDWESPTQAFDTVFHLSATAYVRQGGNASAFGGLSAMYDGAQVYYPTGWHALAALLPGSVSLGANVLVLLLAALVWPLAMAALLRETAVAWARRGILEWDRDAVALAVGVALTGSVVSVLLLLANMWPYALSIVLLPGCLALIVRALEPGWGSRQRACVLLLAGVSMLGVLMAHGTAVFNLAVLAGPLLVVALARPLRRCWVRGGVQRAGILAGAALALTVLLAGVWVMRSALQSVLSYSRGTANLWETVFALFTDHPLLSTFTVFIPGNLLVFVIAMAGAVFAWRRGAHEWVWSFGLSTLLILLAAGPDWPLRSLAGPWYTQRARIMPLVTICLLVLTPLGIAALREYLGRRSTEVSGWRLALTRQMPAVVLAASLIVAPLWRWTLKTQIMQSVHDPAQIAYGTMLSSGELALIQRAASELPGDAVVLGDPSNGSAYLWSVGGVRVLYPSRSAPTSSQLRWLGEHLQDIGTDPQVCQILRQHGVEYYYTDSAPTDGSAGAGPAPQWGSELEDLPREYLQKVDSGGTATLWRITSCS